MRDAAGPAKGYSTGEKESPSKRLILLVLQTAGTSPKGALYDGFLTAGPRKESTTVFNIPFLRMLDLIERRAEGWA
jgi:hypothetical protein